jgi:hypothetical protein
MIHVVVTVTLIVILVALRHILHLDVDVSVDEV